MYRILFAKKDNKLTWSDVTTQEISGKLATIEKILAYGGDVEEASVFEEKLKKMAEFCGIKIKPKVALDVQLVGFVHLLNDFEDHNFLRQQVGEVCNYLDEELLEDWETSYDFTDNYEEEYNLWSQAFPDLFPKFDEE